MEKLNNNFDERLKQYSQEIRSMEIVYHDGRVKCINKRNMTNLKNKNIQDESICIKSENQKKDFHINNEEGFILKKMNSLVIKLIITCIVLISMPFFADTVVNLGINEFISGIGTIFISYFILNIIWIFLE